MNTEIVYILVSDDYDFYWEQALMSMFSLRLYNPTVSVTLITDQITDLGLSGKRQRLMSYIMNKIVVTVPKELTKKQRSRYIKTSLRKYIKGAYLYIDLDTIISSPFPENPFSDMICGAVLDEHVAFPQKYWKGNFRDYQKKVPPLSHISLDKYFNSGVMFVSDVPETHRLYIEWHKAWLEGMKKGMDFDQPALAVANNKCGNIIKELPGIWNCQINSNGLAYFFNACIVHYFASHGRSPFTLGNKDILKKIKEAGDIPDEIGNMIRRHRTAFHPCCKICTGDEINLMLSDIGTLFFYHKHIFAFFERIARFLITKHQR